MKVTKIEDVFNGLVKLGLEPTRRGTKDPHWERIHIHMVLTEADIAKGCNQGTYIGRMSFRYGVFSSCKMFGVPDYYHDAIKLMLDQGKILNHINYWTLRVQAFNDTLELKKDCEVAPGKQKAKAMRIYMNARWSRFTKLFRHRYYGEAL